jgi:hypothetical protein
VSESSDAERDGRNEMENIDRWIEREDDEETIFALSEKIEIWVETRDGFEQMIDVTCDGLRDATILADELTDSGEYAAVWLEYPL